MEEFSGFELPLDGEEEAEQALGGKLKVSGFMSSVAATALSLFKSGGVAA